jgi:CheY-like chemotaxis protein
MMPGMDGVEAVRRIRALGAEDERLLNMPIIALTANAVSGTREMFLQNGFNDFLSKPIDIVKLSAVLGKWIPKEKRVAAAPQGDGGISAQDTVNITIEGVDVKLGVSRTGGKADNYLRTLAVFRNDGICINDELKKFLEAADIKSFAMCVHGLKSAAANIGAASLSESAKALEEAAGRSDTNFIESHTPHLLADLERLLRAIDKAVPPEKNELVMNNSNREVLNSALSALRTALDEMDFAATKAATNELRQFENASEVGGTVKAILEKVLNGEYDEADALIKSLL